MSKTIEFYQDILKFFGYNVNKSGYVINSLKGADSKVTIGGKELVLPTSEQLRDPDISQRLVFHPIPENIARGESDIIKKLLQAINARLNMSAVGVFSSLYDLIVSSEKHGALNADQLELLNAVQADRTGLRNFLKIVKNGAAADLSKLFVSVYLKRGGTVDNKRYSCAGIVRFPLFNELEGSNTTIHGVKMRDKDYDTLIALYKFVFPDLDVKDKYSAGSDSHHIRFLDALLMSSMNLASRLSDIIDIFGDYIEDADLYSFDTSFFDAYSTDLESIINEAKKIPAQPGNAAEVAVQTQPVVQQQQPSHVVQNNQNVQQQQQPQQRQGVIETENGIDIGSILNRGNNMSMMPNNMYGNMNNQPMNMLPNGCVQLPNGAIQMPNGAIQFPNGWIQYPNGQMQPPQQMNMMPQNQGMMYGNNMPANMNQGGMVQYPNGMMGLGNNFQQPLQNNVSTVTGLPPLGS